MKLALNQQSREAQRGRHPLRRQSGVTLIELMVAMTIGLFLLGAVGIIYINTSASSRSSTLESQMNEDANLALVILQQQIRLAGFSTTDASSKRNFSGLGVTGCDKGFTSNSAAFNSLACATTGTNSALAIRYEATPLNSQIAKNATNVDRPDNCAHSAIDPWNASAEGGTTSMILADNRYYIADDGAVPTLYCNGRVGDTFGGAEALIPNIESMAITYAITAAPTAGKPLPHQVRAYVDASGTGSWSRVAAVRICLIARSAQPVPVGSNTNTDLSYYVDCSGNKKTGVTDRYLRRAYATTVQLRNMRPALPAAYSTTNGVIDNPYAYVSTAGQ